MYGKHHSNYVRNKLLTGIPINCHGVDIEDGKIEIKECGIKKIKNSDKDIIIKVKQRKFTYRKDDILDSIWFLGIYHASSRVKMHYLVPTELLKHNRDIKENSAFQLNEIKAKSVFTTKSRIEMRKKIISIMDEYLDKLVEDSRI